MRVFKIRGGKKSVLKEISDLLEKKGRMSHLEIAEELGVNPSSVASLLKILEEKGCVRLRTEERVRTQITADGKRYLREGFPEERALGKSVTEMDEEERRYGIPWALKLMGAKLVEGRLVATERISPHRRALERGEISEDLLRRGLVEKKRERVLIAEFLKGYEEEGLGELTEEDIVSGRWKAARPYNVLARAKDWKIGRRHLISKFAERVRRIFLAMGFQEMNGPYVDAVLWSFDALFQPQDHPARDLMDTFYLEGRVKVPEEAVRKIGEVHRKWWGIWDPEVPEKRLLRPHCTAMSSRYLWERGGPSKFFAIGRVFRNEAIDYKHLAEFHQIEGIIAWEGVNFRNLLGVLKEFYHRLGFEEVRFRPHYFPFTEPSLEIEVRFKGEWIELGGAGIFRPEVSVPLCGIYPVLAWGLSVERPLMIELGIKDIRELYR